MASSSGNNDEDGRGSERRYRPNMQGLLQFCMDNTEGEDAAASSSAETMDPERRAWLNEVLGNVASRDLIKQMAECLKCLHDTDSDRDIKMQALETLQDMCEDIDLAKDLHKMGGFEIIRELLYSDDTEIRAEACALVGILVQNNEYCQHEAVQAGFLPLLLNTLDNDKSTLVQTKALFAISCLTRDFEESQTVFVKKDGFSVLLRAMQSGVEKLQTKSAFMIKALCLSNPQFKEVLCNMGMVEQLVALIQAQHTAAHEHLLGALHNIVEGSEDALKECQRPELNLSNYLLQRKSLIKDKDEFQEELEHCEKLLKYIEIKSSSSVDR